MGNNNRHIFRFNNDNVKKELNVELIGRCEAEDIAHFIELYKQEISETDYTGYTLILHASRLVLYPNAVPGIIECFKLYGAYNYREVKITMHRPQKVLKENVTILAKATGIANFTTEFVEKIWAKPSTLGFLSIA